MLNIETFDLKLDISAFLFFYCKNFRISNSIYRENVTSVEENIFLY